MTFSASPRSFDALGNRSVRTNAFVPGAFVLLMVLYTLSALVQSLLPFSLNRVLGAAVVLLLGFDFVSRLTPKRVIAACVVCLLFVVNVGIFTSDRADELEFYIYWIASLLILCYIGSAGSVPAICSVTRHHKGIVSASVLISSLFVGALLVTHTGYVSEWGVGSYFIGYCNAEHTMASVCCLVMSLSYLCERSGGLKSWIVYPILAILTWAILQTGARTFLVPAIVIWVLFVRDSMSHRWMRIVVYAVLASIAVYSFAFTGMAAKFYYLTGISSGADSFLSSITSGRNEYWATDLGAWAGNGPVAWLFGRSASFVYELNQATFHMRIWSHDDFVMLACSTGLLGLATYIAALKVFFEGVSGVVGRFTLFLLMVFVLFPAVINGFYSYQHLVYSAVFLICAVVSAGVVDDRVH